MLIMEEISLREIIEVLLKRKWLIVGVTLLAIIISGIFSFFVLKPVYEAEGVLNIREGGSLANLESKHSGSAEVVLNIREGGSPGVTAVTEPELDLLLEQLRRFPPANIETYRYRLLSSSFLESVIDKIEPEPEGVTPLFLQGAINIEQVPNTDLIKIIVRYGDPHLAARIANETGNLFIENIKHQNQEQISLASSYLDNKIREKETELGLVMEEYKLFLQEPGGAGELQAEVDAKVTAITENKLELEYLQISLAAARAEREALEKEIGDTDELIVTKKSITDDPFLLKAYEEAGMSGEKPGLEELAGLQMLSEEPNPVYYELLSGLKNKTVEIESTEERIAGISASLDKLQQELGKLYVIYMEKSSQGEALEKELSFYKTTIETLESHYLEMQMIASLEEEGESFNVVSPADAPQSPVEPRKMLNMAIAGVLGLMVSGFLVFFLHYWETSNDHRESTPAGV